MTIDTFVGLNINDIKSVLGLKSDFRIQYVLFYYSFKTSIFTTFDFTVYVNGGKFFLISRCIRVLIFIV
jgi:hypothetical protein